MANLKLTNHFVAFLDVLGFKALLTKESPSTKSYLNSYFQVISKELDSARIEVKRGREFEIKAVLLSDSVVLALEEPFCDDELDPTNELRLQGFRKFLSVVSKIQMALAINKILIRGGISHGEFTTETTESEYQITTGLGLANAVELERLAKDPRVILDPKLGMIFKTSNSALIRSLNEMRDSYECPESASLTRGVHRDIIYSNQKKATDVYYVSRDAHYVNWLREVLYLPEESYRQLKESLKEIAIVPQEHYPKHLWLNSYVSSFSTIWHEAESKELTKSEVERLRDFKKWSSNYY